MISSSFVKIPIRGVAKEKAAPNMIIEKTEAKITVNLKTFLTLSYFPAP